MRLSAHQWRCNDHRVAHGSHHEPTGKAVIAAYQPDITAIREESARALRCDELERTNESHATGLSHQRMLSELAPALLQIRRGFGTHTLDYPLLLKDTNVAHGNSAGNRMAG